MTSATRQPAGDTGGTVLVAQDDSASERDLRSSLEADGYRVISAKDGAAALRLLTAQPVDLVLCEAMLPDMDGIEVCRAIKQAPATRDTPVVVLVAPADEPLRQRAVDAGADDVASTPVERATLQTLVRAQLRIRQLKSQINELEGIVVTLARAVEDRDHSSAGLAEKIRARRTELDIFPAFLF